jgi:hypothetical protein
MERIMAEKNATIARMTEDQISFVVQRETQLEVKVGFACKLQVIFFCS